MDIIFLLYKEHIYVLGNQSGTECIYKWKKYRNCVMH